MSQHLRLFSTTPSTSSTAARLCWALVGCVAAMASSGCNQPGGGQVPDAVATPDTFDDVHQDLLLVDTPGDATSPDGIDTGNDTGNDSGGDTTVSDIPDIQAPDLPPQPTSYTYNTSCSIPADPSAGGVTIGFEPAFSGANINGPLMLTHANDGSGRLFVAERDGRIKVFPKVEPTPTATTYLDFSSAVDTGSEGGFLGLAFHPQYASNGYVFTSYTSSNILGDGNFYNVLSRWKVSDSDPDQADPDSELVFLTVLQTAKNHNGGDLAFGPDGMLYMTIGDGGPQGDPAGHGQNTSTWLGSIIRIDIDTPQSVSKHYSIPADNPFAQDTTGAVKEIYAWGFRNPWRMTFDRLTGSMWVGDVGQGRIEEAGIIGLGTNAGWRIMEGPECYPNNNGNCSTAGLKQPEVYYYHQVDGKEGGGRSITGGYVYRGSDVPALYGAYLYADWNVPNVWGYKHGEEPMPTPDDGSGALFVGPGQVGSFGQDAQGEVYMLKLYGGEAIWRFTQTETAPQPANFPQTLTETGCFSNVGALTPVDGLFSYAVNAPLWSDTALKKRWFVLPQDATITYAADGTWEFPVGTIFIKHFAIETTQGDPATEVRLETRFMVQEADGQTRGYTYRWNEEGTEAYLLNGAETRDLSLTLAGQPAQEYQWRFPSRTQCSTCHNSITGGPLGLETGQLNRDHPYPELYPLPINTIDALGLYGLLDSGPAEPASDLLAFAELNDGTASLADRARAYLHSNCANCHREQSASGVSLDLSWTTELGAMNACNEPPTKGDLGFVGAQLITPGDAASSIVYQRMVTPDHGARMPPISAALVDAEAASAVADWINSLEGCL